MNLEIFKSLYGYLLVSQIIISIILFSTLSSYVGTLMFDINCNLSSPVYFSLVFNNILDNILDHKVQICLKEVFFMGNIEIAAARLHLFSGVFAFLLSLFKLFCSIFPIRQLSSRRKALLSIANIFLSAGLGMSSFFISIYFAVALNKFMDLVASENVIRTLSIDWNSVSNISEMSFKNLSISSFSGFVQSFLWFGIAFHLFRNKSWNIENAAVPFINAE